MAASAAIVVLLATTGCGVVPTAPRVDASAPAMSAAVSEEGGGELEILDSPGGNSGGQDVSIAVGESFIPSLGHPPAKKSKKPKKPR
jgi:hypothetical protein